MSTVREIEEAILKLPPKELGELRTWFASLDDDQWLKQITKDVEEGRLDDLAEQAQADLRKGDCRDL